MTESTAPRRRAIFAITDMFFRSKVETALAAVPELEVSWLEPGESLAERGGRERPDFVVVDLQDPALEPLRQVAQLKAAPAGAGIEVAGFLPHVRMDLREAAGQAGVDRIYTRSAFTRLLPTLLAQLGQPGSASRKES